MPYTAARSASTSRWRRCSATWRHTPEGVRSSWQISPPTPPGCPVCRRETGDWHLPALAGAGALRSSVGDLLTLLHAHVVPDSTPLEAAVRAVLEVRARISGPLAVGLGWHLVERRDGARWWWHNGGTGGFRSYVAFDPSARRGVAVLANDTRSVDRIGQLLLAPQRG